MNRKWKIGAALIGLAAAVALVLAIPAMGNRPPKHPNPPPPPPVLPPPAPPVCPDGLPPTPGEGAYDPNDDCARAPTPPPLIVTTPPPTPGVVPPAPLKCDAGMTVVSQTATKIVCATVVVVTKTKKGKTIVKRVKQRPKLIPVYRCPKPRHPEKLTG